VATVKLELAAHEAPYFHEHDPDPFTAVARVEQNTFVFPVVPRDASVAMERPVFVWRDARGRVVRVVRGG
jgi:hypothetical protein